MPKLSDLVNVKANEDVIHIQGKIIPVSFTMESIQYVQEAYNKPYKYFVKDMEKLLNKGQFTLGNKEIKVMYAIIYAMIRTGGTECTPQEVRGAVMVEDLPNVFRAAYKVFKNKDFQVQDLEKFKSKKK